MRHHLPIGNGNIQINFDEKYRIFPIHFRPVDRGDYELDPSGICKFGVWVDGQFALVENGWNISTKYLEDTLVTDVLLQSDRSALQIRVHDMVDNSRDLLLREFHVIDLSGQDREVRLFFNQHDFGNRAFHDSITGGIIHVKDYWLLTNVCSNGESGIAKWAIGAWDGNKLTDTFRDAEDGMLCCNAEVQSFWGQVNSTVLIKLNVPAKREAIAHLWMCFGRTQEDVMALNNSLRQENLFDVKERVQNYWRLWVNSKHIDFLGLPASVIDLYKRSLLILHSQTHSSGAMAGTLWDSDSYGEQYQYSWPHDGALVAHAFSQAGHSDIADRFFIFCDHVLMKDVGYLCYTVDDYDVLGSNCYPNGVLWDQPIRQDETALVLWSLWQHFNKYRDEEFAKTVFGKLLIKGADFLVNYRDPETKLPRQSEHNNEYGLHLFTVASVIGGLTAAANFCHALGEISRANHYQEIVDEVRAAMLRYMWNDKEKRFCRMATRCEAGYALDMNVDAEMYAIFAFNALSLHDEKVLTTMHAIETLLSKTTGGDWARFENDRCKSLFNEIGSAKRNQCLIDTMRLAQYKTAAASSPENLREPLAMLEWVAHQAIPTGVVIGNFSILSEAAFVTCVLDYLQKRSQMISE